MHEYDMLRNNQVFGPGQQVMNGISFLITLTQDYDKVFSGFCTVMERTAAFLQRMKIYLDSQTSTVLDKRLRPDVYEVLNHFTMVLGHSHKLATSKSRRLKLMAGLLFFGDDQGVSGSLAKLEVKIANVSRTEITLILRGVSEAARNLRTLEEKVDRLNETATRTDATATRTEAGVGQLIAEQDRRSAEEQKDQNTKLIRNTLNPDGNSPWLESHTKFQNQILKGTGAWLLQDHQLFSRFIDPEVKTTNVFGLSGDEGYGKSCICSTVVQWLLEKYSKGRSDDRVAVAYYYFNRDAKEKASINRAVRDILWQLTQYNPSYATDVASACEGSEEINKTFDLWNKFINDGGKKMISTFYVILDGIDEPETDPERPLAAIIKDLLAAQSVTSQLQLRLFISGRPSGFETLEKAVESTIPIISLGVRPGSDEMPKNQADILSYIEHYLDNMDVFKDNTSDEVSELRMRIPNELAAGVKGDFVSLTYKLEEISKCTRVRQIEQVLGRASETREEAIKRGVNNLNASLNRDEIEELNEILNFVIGAMVSSFAQRYLWLFNTDRANYT